MFKLCTFVALIAMASALSNPSDTFDQITSARDSPNTGDGAYDWSIQTSNGIAQQESGVGGKSAQGTAAWYAPDGTPVFLAYIADEFGYRPTGSHIPTPPPIPAAILRSLEYIRTHSTPAPPTSAPVYRFGRQRLF